MLSHRRTVFILFLTSLLLIPSRVSDAQEAPADNQQVESDEEMFRKAEEDVRLLTSKGFIRDESNISHRAERRLKNILQLYPKTPLLDRVEENLSQVQEMLALHDLQIARFYFNRGGVTKGAESRLLQITREYPKFSRMDEVLLLLGQIHLRNEQLEDAANYFWKLVCKYPGSRYINDAFEQLSRMGFDASKDCDSLKP